MTVQAAYRDFDVAVDALVRDVRAQGATIPCREGCAACCYEPVAASSHEVDAIMERVRDMSEVKPRVQAWMQRAGMLGLLGTLPDTRQYFSARLACPLLDVQTRTCVVYDVRPIACRAHLLVDMDPAVCANRDQVPAIDTLRVDAIAVSAITSLSALGPMVIGSMPELLHHQLSRAP